MQLLAVVVLGGVVTAAFRTLDARREGRREEAAEDREEQRKIAAEKRADRRLLDEYLGGLAGELIDAYLRIKAVRRKLRAIGLRPPVSGRLSPEQRDDYREQMDVLVDAQLALEKVKDDVDNQPPVFAPHGALISKEIRRAEGYVNEVIKEWEDHNADFQSGSDLSAVMAPLGHLQSFLLGAHEDDGLKDNVSSPIAEAARLIHSRRLRVSPSERGVPSSEDG
jgi:hypothetical protein